MFVNDDIYYLLSDMTENEKRKEGDYLMTCFVIHVSLLSYTFFEKQLFYKKVCRLSPTYKFELGINWFSINHRNIDNHFSYEKGQLSKMGVTKKAIYRKSASQICCKGVILVYRPHSLEGRDLSFCMPVQRRESSKELGWFGRLNQVLETTTMR